MKSNLHINAKKEAEKIVNFLKDVFKKTGKRRAVLGWSGGIDSTVCLYLLVKALDPNKVFAYHLPYEKTYKDELFQISKQLHIPQNNIRELPIKKMVNTLVKTLSATEKIRKGNITARLRMITLFDQAKLHDALVCGTENRSEHLLGYFTRFGDSASDIEPVCHLFKTQIYQLATYLGVPGQIVKRSPTAGLWDGQTDEGEFGFTYQEADEVLHYLIDKNKSIRNIQTLGYKKALQVRKRFRNNIFKSRVPYLLP